MMVMLKKHGMLTMSGKLPRRQYELLRQTLWDDEGLRLKPYMDTTGNLTIGHGHKVLDKDNIKPGDVITKERAEELYHKDVDTAIQDAYSFVPNIWDDLSPERQNILINMAYNLGGPKLNKFVEMRKGLQSDDYVTASKEMLNSIWSGQVGDRSKRLADRMINNEWGSDLPWDEDLRYFAEEPINSSLGYMHGLFN